MELLIAFFLFGLAVGSFLNVLIDRLPNDLSIMFPPSHCDNCKKKLGWYDLIPVLSFVLLGGRCRYCHSPISVQYPIVELLTGGFFVLVLLYLPSNDLVSIIYYLVFVSALIVIFFTDLKYGIIPDKVIFAAIPVSLVYLFIHHSSFISNHLLAAASAFLFFLAIYLLTKGRGMGFGDVKLAFLLGLFFGFPKIAYVVYVAFLTGAGFSIILLVLGKKKLKETIVFGPFLVLASFVVLFFHKYLQNLWTLPN